MGGGVLNGYHEGKLTKNGGSAILKTEFGFTQNMQG